MKTRPLSKVLLLAGAVCAVLTTLGCERRMDFNLRLAPGDARTVANSYTFTMASSIIGLEAETEVNLEKECTLQITEVEGGAAQATGTYNEFKMNMSLGAAGLSFNTKGGLGSLVSGLMPDYEKAEGMTFTCEITPGGVVRNVQGHEAIIDAILARFEGNAREERRAALREQMGDEVVAKDLTNSLALHPPEPVRIGESWTAEEEVTGVFPMQLTTTFTPRERKQGDIIVDLSVSIEEIEAPELKNAEAKYVVSGSGTGTAIVDARTGWVKSRKVEMEAEDTRIDKEVRFAIEAEVTSSPAP